MNRDQVVATVEQYVAALNAKDPDGVLAVFSHDIVHVEPVGGRTRRGHAELRPFFEAGQIDGWHVSLEGPVMAIGQHAAFVLRVTLEVPDGDDLVFASTDVIELNDEGLICRFTAYPDVEAVLS
ncbi:nuclear transport factor 2 family protein [Nocardioides sp.]|uniref:nuclear transport factor 2 family protein n=1 Tax=Nocardioides sp. TaxID=35761 RepID=UPI00356280A5